VQSNGSEPKAYQSNGYVLLEQLFPPLVLAIFHGKLQKDLNLKADPEFPLSYAPADETGARGLQPPLCADGDVPLGPHSNRRGNRWVRANPDLRLFSSLSEG